MEHFKVVWRRLGANYRSLFYPEIEYQPFIVHDDGPFFAFRNYKSAEDYAIEFARSFASLSTIEDIAILKVVGNPLDPQPKRVPALYAPVWLIDAWRSLVLQDVFAADQLFERMGSYYYDVPQDWVILRNFYIVEVVSVFRPEGVLSPKKKFGGGYYVSHEYNQPPRYAR